MLRASSPAVPYLRRRTVGRAFHAYRKWVGRAVGWWTILYMLFWLAVFVIAGVESLAPLATFLPSPALVLALGGALVVAATFAGGRAPPLVLDRRDLYRLALGPERPWSVLAWRYSVKQAGFALVALLLGGAWSLLAPALFGLSAPFAAPALALLALFLLDLRWLRYVLHEQHGEHGARASARAAYAAAAAAALLLLGAGAAAHLSADAAGARPLTEVAAVVDPLAALTRPSPLTLLVPFLLALLTGSAVRRTLAREWPPRFAPQSLVLTQLQALRSFEVMAALAGMGRAADAGERRRLLDALHDRPGATRPRRSLPLPGAAAPQWRAFAWRSAGALYRRPLLGLVGALLLALFAATGALSASGAVSVPLAALTAAEAAGGAGSGGAAGLGGGALGTLLTALLLARAAAGLLGPTFEAGTRPVDPLTRALGRALPAALLLTLMLLPAAALLALLSGALGGAIGVLLPGVVGAVTLVGLVVLALEKYSSWSGAAPGRFEPQLVAAMLAAAPALLLGAMGVGEWTLLAQLLLLGLVSIIAV